MKKLFLIVAIVCSQAHAQVDQKGVWQFPVSARTYCQNIEQNLVAEFKRLVETNRKWMDNTTQEDKRQYPQITEVMKQSIKDSEESWHRMDCTNLLYGSTKR
jgi:GH18 family chitinase